MDGKEIEVFKWERTASLTPEQILSAFRNSYNPRIAVTVDRPSLAGAGVGGWKPGEGRRAKPIKPLEIVFFMRSVASKNFFEQMEGRGVCVVSDTEMEQVNPGVKRKTRYLIVDAVGVTERVHTESRPLEKKPTVSFDKLLDAAVERYRWGKSGVCFRLFDMLKIPSVQHHGYANEIVVKFGGADQLRAAVNQL